MSFSTAPDFLFIDAILLSYRLGHIKLDIQKTALLAASRAATDALTFMRAAENFGIANRTALHTFLGKYLAAPSFYRDQYSRVLGIRLDSAAPEPFLNNLYALALPEGVLTIDQNKLFYNTYWWFVKNHQSTYYDIKKGLCIGAYASAPQDNNSTLDRFEDYLYRLANKASNSVRARYKDFPADIVAAILKRAFTE